MKKFISIILSLVMCLTTPIIANAADVDDKSINAKSVVLMDLDSKKVLYAKDENERLSPASVTKIMSILLILEALDNGKIKLTDKISASKNAVSMGGSQIWLEVGETMTVDELLKAVVVASANDACSALGEYVGGSSTGFVKMMNDRAKVLGLKNTSFENCTGLDDTTKNHYSSAYDLGVIACEVMKHSKVLDYTTIWLDSLRNGETELNNTNKLVNTFDGITGLKTGTTSNAGFCVCATASRDNMNLVAVVLGSDTSEHRFETASYLLDWGFANFECVKPKVDAKKIKPVKVMGGVEKSVTPKYKASSIMLEKGYDKLEYKYNILESVKAPVKKNQILGNIEILSNNKTISKINLYSNNSIAKIDFYTIFRHLLINI